MIHVVFTCGVCWINYRIIQILITGTKIEQAAKQESAGVASTTTEHFKILF